MFLNENHDTPLKCYAHSHQASHRGGKSLSFSHSSSPSVCRQIIQWEFVNTHAKKRGRQKKKQQKKNPHNYTVSASLFPSQVSGRQHGGMPLRGARVPPPPCLLCLCTFPLHLSHHYHQDEWWAATQTLLIRVFVRRHISNLSGA